MLNTKTSFSALVLLSAILFSCCHDIEEVHEKNRQDFSLNEFIELEDTTTIKLNGLKMNVYMKEEVEGVNRYCIDLSGQRISFYSYEDDIYTDSPGYGKNAIILQRGNYEVTVGKPDDGLMCFVMPTYSCCRVYVHPDMPEYGIRLAYCEENSGIISGEIKLGTDIPKYSSLKFTLVERENGVVLKKVVLER